MCATVLLREMDCVGQVNPPAQHELSRRPNTTEKRYTLSIENELDGDCRDLLQAPMIINKAGALMNGYFLDETQLQNQGYWAKTFSLKVMTANLMFGIPAKKIRLIAQVDNPYEIPYRYLTHGFRPTYDRRINSRFSDPAIHDIEPKYGKEYVLHPAHLQQHVTRALSFLEQRYVVIPGADLRSVIRAELYHDVEMARPEYLQELRKMASCRVHQGLPAGCQLLQLDNGGPTRRKKRVKPKRLTDA